MSMTGGRRTQAERDAMTVEIGYALVSAVFAAAVVFGAVAGPVWLFEMPGTVETVLTRAGLVLLPVVFFVRVVTVLYRYRRAATQPSQPGRTNPDS
jgi:membrane protein YdbS with pleckstrin-like domain